MDDPFRRPPPQPNALDELFSPSGPQDRVRTMRRQIDDLLKTEPRFNTAEEMVGYSCRQNIDFTHMLVAVWHGVYGINTPVKREVEAGEAVLGGIDSYIRKATLVTKRLTGRAIVVHPDNPDPMDDVRFARTLVTAIKELERDQIFKSRYPHVEGLMHSAVICLEDAERRGVPDTIGLLFSKKLADSERVRGVRIREGQMWALNDINEFRQNRNAQDEEGLRLYEKLIGRARYMSEAKIDGLVDPYTTRFGGVSLRELVAMRDHHQFIDGVFRYLQHIPQGDFFWQNFAANIFFETSSRFYNIDPGTFFEYPQMARNIIYLHAHMAEHIFLPAISGRAPDRRFERSFAGLLDRMDGDVMGDIAFAVFQTARAPYARLQPFYPQRSSKELIMGNPLSRFIHEAHGERLVRPEQMMLEVLYEKRDAILLNLITRFGGSRNSKMFNTRLSTTLSDTQFNSAYVAWLYDHVLQTTPEEIRSRFLLGEEDPIRAGFSPQVPATDRIDTNGVVEAVAFPEDSFATKLGMRDVYFDVHSRRSGLWTFGIHFAEKNAYVSGYLNPQTGEVQHLSVPDAGRYQGLHASIKLIVERAFIDAVHYREQEGFGAHETIEQGTFHGKRSREKMSPDAAHDALQDYMKGDQ